MDKAKVQSGITPEYTVVEIEFPEARLLPSADSTSGESTGPREQFLEGETRWEPKLSKADKLDCEIAVASGVITGLVDSFFVGKISFERASEWGSKKTNGFVIALAKLSGYEGEELKGAIKHLEKKFEFAADGTTDDFGGGRQHHFRDFSHHFNLGGLVCSLFTQFTGKAIGTDPEGRLIFPDIPESHAKHLGNTFQEKVIKGTVTWLFHIASDIAGSSSNPSSGTGVPGPILSLVKQLSALPIFQEAHTVMERGEDEDLNLRELISKLFNGTLLGKRDESGKIIEPLRFDFRMELGIVHEVGRQAVPVLLNQCFIRSFYFVRRFVHEIKALGVYGIDDLSRVDPADVLPFRNAAIARMSTISSGVFTIVDATDALVRAAIASKGKKEVFLGEFIVRINFVGVGTFAIACALDIREMLKERSSDEADRIESYERELVDLHCLELGPEQVRLLQSLQHSIVVKDIEMTKKARKRESKKIWLAEWEDAVSKGLAERGVLMQDYLLDELSLYALFDELASSDPAKPWPYLIALEADLMMPYPPLGGDSDKEFKGLKFESDYMLDVFCRSQAVVSKADIESLRKAMRRSEGEIDAKLAKNVAKVVGTVVIATAATVAAFVFAPVIAPLIAGEAVAGLSGAALTSASLAFVGGGALAAGGLGMAGGTAIIAGGGAVLGALGGTGITQLVTTMSNADGFVYLEASKLLCYSEEVLLKRYADVGSVRKIKAALNERILELNIELHSLKENKDNNVKVEGEKTSEGDIPPKKQAKVLSRSLKYLKRCNERLAKDISSAVKD